MADILTDALTGLNYTPADTGFGIAQQSLSAMTPQLITPYTSTGRAVGIGLGSILLQSLLGYQARQQAAQDTLAVNTLANQLQTLETPQARTDFIKGVEDTGYQSRLSNLATALGAQEAARKTKIAEKIAEKEALANFELGDLGKKLADEEIRREIAKNMAKMRQLQAALGGRGGAGGGGRGGDELPTPAAPLGVPFNELQARRDALIERAKSMGMTANQANAYANSILAPDTLATKKAQNLIDASRERANKLEQVSTTARVGVEGAGQTGGALGGLRELASQYYAVVSPEEQRQRDAQKILDSVRPQIVNMLRSPGAVTDFETKLLMGSGPSSGNTPSENTALLAGMDIVAGLEADYADFVENYVSMKGTSVGADALWRQYKNEEVFPTGKYNSQRMDWQSWLASRGQPSSVMAGEIPTESDAEKKNRELKARLAQLEAMAARRAK